MTNNASATWFITGASAGFGLAFTRYALDRGYRVVATARRPAKLDDLAAAHPERLCVVRLDVTSPAESQAAIQAAVRRFGSIDVLINNAGYGTVGAVEETPLDELRAQMETNFFGAFNVIQAALPQLRAQRSGAIVNISSLGGQLSYGGFGAYSASKFALEGLSEALAQEMAPFGVKVMIVEPGAFRTDFAGGALKQMPVLDAYRDVVGEIRSFAAGMHETQAGDPAKAAAAIDQAVAAAETPLRLQLGEDAVTAVRAHAEQLLKDLEAWAPVALETKFEA